MQKNDSKQHNGAEAWHKHCKPLLQSTIKNL